MFLMLRYYDLLLSNQVGFPLKPTKRRFIQTEKLIHIVIENFSSICVSSVFLINENHVELVAVISLMSSCLMTVALLFVGGCEIMFSKAKKYGHGVDVIITLCKDGMTGPLRARQIKKEIQNSVSTFEAVNVWYIFEKKRNYEVHVFLQSLKDNGNLDEDKVKRAVEKALDILEYHTRKSIVVENAFAPKLQIGPLTSQLDDQYDEQSDSSILAHPYYYPVANDLEDLWGKTFDQSMSLGTNEPAYVQNSVFDVSPSLGIEHFYKHNSLDDLLPPITGINEYETVKRLYDGPIKRNTNEKVYHHVDDTHLLTRDDIKLDLKDLIAQGHFGAVYSGEFRGIKCAFKKSDGITRYALENILFKVASQHSCICRYFGICKYDEKQYFLVMEYFPDGCLKDVVDHHKFNIQKKTYFCLQLAKGLWHLHSEKVLHGDLALRNVLIDIKNDRVVITDFGASCRFPCIEKRDVISPRWSSPELVKTRILTHDSDIFALAVCFWELWTDGKMPYENVKFKAVSALLVSGGLCLNCDEFPKEIGLVLKEILDRPQRTNITAKGLVDKLQNIMDNYDAEIGPANEI